MKQFRTTKTMQYVAKDHLGSVMALYSDTRTLIEEFSYDAWGRRRNPTNWTFTSVPTATNTRHGFTGHEHLDKYTLINMNGRVYDPVTGRFLSPDPVLQDPANAQNYNKYSYVWNNPLKYTDPSGNISEEWSYWQRANLLNMQSNSWSRYFRNTGISQDMIDVCMEYKYASLYSFAFSSDGGGAGGGESTAAAAPAGGNCTSSSSSEGGGEGGGVSDAIGEDPTVHYPNTYFRKTLWNFSTAEERGAWNKMFCEMVSREGGYTYLDDYLYKEATGEDLGNWWINGVVSRAPIIGGFVIIMEGEQELRKCRYKMYGKNMGVFIKTRTLTTGVSVTDVYWGDDGTFFYVYNGVFDY